ncbi:DUF6384 family protein [Pseudomonas protegens]|uniref:DUF6384 family protein n=1 Tax=Pseudomonas protegens TaxID=380021 RepID=UPI0015E89241|nr:DUF6384 family protein [Pseudomonas protegens]
MSGVSLSEQMGAMALIDELRHNQTEIQKHLDLPKHRKAVAERIREFYKAQGVEVEDALVEQGVRKYFATRLTYEAPTLRWWEQRLADGYLRRYHWLKWVAIWTPIVLFSLNAWTHVIIDVKEQRRYTYADLVGLQNEAHSRTQQVFLLQEQITQLEPVVANSQVASAGRLLDKAKARLATARQQTTIKLPQFAVPEEQRSFNDGAMVSNARTDLRRSITSLKYVRSQLDEIDTLLTAAQKLKSLTASREFRVASKVVPEVAAAAKEAQGALDEADDRGAARAMAKVDQAVRLTDQQSLNPNYLATLEAARASVRQMNLSQADAAQFQPLLSKVEQAIQALDVATTTHGLKEIEQLLAFAKTPLTLDIVSRTGEKSMVERNFDATGGKSWYLLTEATDAAGNVLPVPITSIETGEKRYASVFGVRVNQATYQEVKNDKLADGHVDNRRLGSKDANSLSFKFLKGRTTAKPAYILEW